MVADLVDSIETSAAWPRAPVPKFDKAKDSIGELGQSLSGHGQSANRSKPSSKSILRITTMGNSVRRYGSLVSLRMGTRY